MTPAPFRLGLTATYPKEAEQEDGRWRLEELVGPIVYSLKVDDLVGDRLALYRTQRLRVSLTPAERLAYDRDIQLYLGFVKQRGLRTRYHANWMSALIQLSAKEQEARAALLARQRINRLLAGCQGKMQAVDTLLKVHQTEQTLIFTENNEVAYAISRRYLIPIITHHTTTAERKDILDGFRDKLYRSIVTTHVLNEGVDLPEAKVAIILGGAREHGNIFSGWGGSYVRWKTAKRFYMRSWCEGRQKRAKCSDDVRQRERRWPMLTSDLIKPYVRSTSGKVVVALLSESNPTYLQAAEELIDCFKETVGKTRMAWWQAREEQEGTRTDYLRLRGLAKVLEDEGHLFLPASTLHPSRTAPQALRTGSRLPRTGSLSCGNTGRCAQGDCCGTGKPSGAGRSSGVC